MPKLPADRHACTVLQELIQRTGMDSGALSLPVSYETAQELGWHFTPRQISAAHNRAAGYVLGELLANLAEGSFSINESEQFAAIYKRDIEFH